MKVQPPVITSSDCEGAGEVFELSARADRSTAHQTSGNAPEAFFRASKYLTVSSQLHLEAYIHEHHGVWTLSPTFRAEKSDTPRHLSEFSMLEVELRTDSLSQVMGLTEEIIRTVVKNLYESGVGQELLGLQATKSRDKNRADTASLDVIRRRWESLMGEPWPRITYLEALERLQEATASGSANFESAPSWERGLLVEHEKYLSDNVGHGSPVFVTDYPLALKPFYMLKNETHLEGSPDTVACFDLLFPGVCEVVGGSLREHRLSELARAMRAHGLDKATPTTTRLNGQSDAGGFGASGDVAPNLDWYVDLRRYGSFPHGGFGLGLDRLLGYLAGASNIRDVVPFPRYYGTCLC